MSDSSLSEVIPPDSDLEKGLRKAVSTVYESGNLENLTVKRIRKAVEEELELPEDFFKSDVTWKEKSKEIIQTEVDAHTAAQSSSQPPPSSNQPPKTTPPRPKPAKVTIAQPKGIKRVSDVKAGSKRKKRQTKSVSEVDGSASEDNEATGKGTKVKSKTHETRPSPSSDVDPGPAPEEDRLETDGGKTEQSESELSELLDEAPKPKGKRRKAESAKPKARKADGKKATEQSVNPDAEEIKRLQGWLIKCGIRKMWYKELAPYDTPKARIRHLKEMLADAGMSGRYSAEKASQIKEERELKADLEAVQEGAKHWGKEESEADGANGRPKRRVARGLQGLDFLNADDGEETD